MLLKKVSQIFIPIEYIILDMLISYTLGKSDCISLAHLDVWSEWNQIQEDHWLIFDHNAWNWYQLHGSSSKHIGKPISDSVYSELFVKYL